MSQLHSILFLDDDQERHKVFKALCPVPYTAVETAQACIEAMQNAKFDIVLLDHDLGGEQYVDSTREDCGMEVVRWMVENNYQPLATIVHSYNSNAAKQMVDSLHSHGVNTMYLPFGMSDFVVFVQRCK